MPIICHCQCSSLLFPLSLQHTLMLSEAEENACHHLFLTPPPPSVTMAPHAPAINGINKDFISTFFFKPFLMAFHLILHPSSRPVSLYNTNVSWTHLSSLHFIINPQKVQCPECVTQYNYVNLQVLFTVGTVLMWRSNRHQSQCYCIHTCWNTLYYTSYMITTLGSDDCM